MQTEGPPSPRHPEQTDSPWRIRKGMTPQPAWKDWLPQFIALSAKSGLPRPSPRNSTHSIGDLQSTHDIVPSFSAGRIGVLASPLHRPQPRADILQPRKTGQHPITAEKRRAVLVSTAPPRVQTPSLFTPTA